MNFYLCNVHAYEQSCVVDPQLSHLGSGNALISPASIRRSDWWSMVEVRFTPAARRGSQMFYITGMRLKWSWIGKNGTLSFQHNNNPPVLMKRYWPTLEPSVLDMRPGGVVHDLFVPPHLKPDGSWGIGRLRNVKWGWTAGRIRDWWGGVLGLPRGCFQGAVLTTCGPQIWVWRV